MFYSDYLWHFEITSTIHEVLPNYTIKFGIGHGDINGEEAVSVENQAYSYTFNKVGNKKIAKFKNPFWFYYAFGIYPADEDAFTLCDMYYNSYKALKDKGLSNLDLDEVNLYNTLVGYLSGYEADANLFYKPAVYVIINNKYYKVARYKR